MKICWWTCVIFSTFFNIQCFKNSEVCSLQKYELSLLSNSPDTCISIEKNNNYLVYHCKLKSLIDSLYLNLIDFPIENGLVYSLYSLDRVPLYTNVSTGANTDTLTFKENVELKLLLSDTLKNGIYILQIDTYPECEEYFVYRNLNKHKNECSLPMAFENRMRIKVRYQNRELEFIGKSIIPKTSNCILLKNIHLNSLKKYPAFHKFFTVKE